MIRHIGWSDEFLVGYDIIDTQHQHLFKIADKLYNLLQNDYDESVVDEVAVECAEYVIFHFNTEEEMMKEIGYSGMEFHKRYHEEFSAYVSTLIGDLTAGKRIDIVQLYTYIVDWLVDHILSEDKRLALEINRFLGNQ